MIKIRKAIVEDALVIAGFQLEMALETENLKLDAQTVTKGVLAVFTDERKGRYYVAEKNGEVIGCLLTTFEWSDWRNAEVLWIQSVFVSPMHRQSGIYRRLYEFVKIEVLDSGKYTGIRLYVDNTNEKAKHVYTKQGMNGEHYSVFEWMKGS